MGSQARPTEAPEMFSARLVPRSGSAIAQSLRGEYRSVVATRLGRPKAWHPFPELAVDLGFKSGRLWDLMATGKINKVVAG